MRITHRQVQLIQEDAYYPFGMTHSSYTLPNAAANPYKYNGKEEQDELNVGWLDYGAPPLSGVCNSGQHVILTRPVSPPLHPYWS
jgi:CubicO group peptidase (beta-lactamase class C family)